MKADHNLPFLGKRFNDNHKDNVDDDHCLSDGDHIDDADDDH